MATQSANIYISASATGTKDGRETTGKINHNREILDGVIVNTADKCFYGLRTIAATGSPDALDFAGGGLIDLNGDAITWVDMVALVVKAPATNTVNIVVGAHANAFDFGIGVTATMTIKPGETKVLINIGADPGYAIAAGSADAIKLFIASGANQVLEVLAIGRSA